LRQLKACLRFPRTSDEPAPRRQDEKIMHIDPIDETRADETPEGESAERQAEASPGDVTRPHKPRGFAAIDRNLVKEIARKGGKAAHAAGTAHEFTSEEARVAGRKGGQATHANRRRPAAAPEASK
jgi:general stress protein YciG